MAELKICCSRALYAVQGGYMLFRRVKWMFSRVVYCSGGLYAVQEGYVDVQWGHMLFRGVICCSSYIILSCLDSICSF